MSYSCPDPSKLLLTFPAPAKLLASLYPALLYPNLAPFPALLQLCSRSYPSPYILVQQLPCSCPAPALLLHCPCPFSCSAPSLVLLLLCFSPATASAILLLLPSFFSCPAPALLLLWRLSYPCPASSSPLLLPGSCSYPAYTPASTLVLLLPYSGIPALLFLRLSSYPAPTLFLVLLRSCTAPLQLQPWTCPNPAPAPPPS